MSDSDRERAAAEGDDRRATGFIDPTPPPFDVEEWKRKPHLERVKPLAQDWAVNGFGTPTAIYLLYIV